MIANEGASKVDVVEIHKEIASDAHTAGRRHEGHASGKRCVLALRLPGKIGLWMPLVVNTPM